MAIRQLAGGPRGGNALSETQTRFVSQTTLAWRQFKRHKLAIISLLVFALMAVMCLAAPVVAPYEFDAINLKSIRQPPSWSNLMGTDDLGRDLFTRVLYGGRISIAIGIFAALVGTGFGSLLGAIGGYYGGHVDDFLMRFTDVAYSIPSLPLLIVLSALAKAGVPTIVLIIGFLSWMPTARVVRGQVLSIKQKEYIESARMIGARNWVIILRHILPNTVGPIIVGVTLGVGNAIVIESSLSFLGLGVQPPTPTWGNMLMDAQSTMATKPWLTIFPGLAILVIVLAVNFVGDGLHDALDPTLRTR
jgi:peptide/nickel transport system permease protein